MQLLSSIELQVLSTFIACTFTLIIRYAKYISNTKFQLFENS